jgi:8-oxo-dGTP pyrophosphatase MutT (NUDIX family)
MTNIAYYGAEYSAKNSTSPYAITAGGIVYKKTEAAYEYLLLVRYDDMSYHLPKGTLYVDETIEHCALREIQEESGAKTKLTAYLGAVTNQYTYKGNYYDKTTHYYAAECIELTADMDAEHDAREWCSYDEAMTKLRRGVKQENRFLERCNDFLHERYTISNKES